MILGRSERSCFFLGLVGLVLDFSHDRCSWKGVLLLPFLAFEGQKTAVNPSSNTGLGFSWNILEIGDHRAWWYSNNLEKEDFTKGWKIWGQHWNPIQLIVLRISLSQIRKCTIGRRMEERGARINRILLPKTSSRDRSSQKWGRDKMAQIALSLSANQHSVVSRT